ncbi:hypothetical protein HWV62_26921 [Athelia sp. TMB]|nr:hypothetical protein HWV62_26921 [Athelia sp. TMB]
MILFIEAFGHKHHTAPAEAEAELAMMSSEGLLDAIITDDSDALLFGARTIIQNWNIKKDKGMVRIYNSQSMPFEQDDFILLGVLLGGDYDNKTGLKGCGPKTGVALANTGFGKSLCSAARLRTTDEFKKFLDKWCIDVQQYLRTDPNGHMGSKHRALASSMAIDFPNPDIVYMYTSPLTSTLADAAKLASGFSQPNIISITQLCELYFPWATSNCILDKFGTLGVFPAIAIASLRDAAAFLHPNVGILPAVALPFFESECILGTDTQIKGGVRHRTVTVTTDNLHRTVLASLRGLRQNLHNNAPPARPTASTLTVWVPEVLIAACVDSMHAVTVHSFPDYPEPLLHPAESLAPASTQNRIKLDMQLLRQAFASFLIEPSQVAALIGAYMLAGLPAASMRSVSATFIKHIEAVTESKDGASKLRWWRRYVQVIGSLQEPIASLLDAEVAASNGSGGSVNADHLLGSV